MKILVVIDMQNDFIDGALGTKEAQAIVPKVAEKIKNFDGKVFYTRDTHDEKYIHLQSSNHSVMAHLIRLLPKTISQEILDRKSTRLNSSH